MNIKLKKIRNNTDSRQSEKLVIPHLNSTDKYNSSFHRPQLITRTIHSRKNGLTWLLYYTSYVRTTKSLYIKKHHLQPDSLCSIYGVIWGVINWTGCDRWIKWRYCWNWLIFMDYSNQWVLVLFCPDTNNQSKISTDFLLDIPDSYPNFLIIIS